MAPLGTAESTTGNINEDLQHYKKKLNESMPRALFPWLWPVPISNRRWFEMGEISPSLSPSRGLHCSALIDALQPPEVTCCPHASLVSVLTPKCCRLQQLGPALALSHTLVSAGGSYVPCKRKHSPSLVTKMSTRAQKCNQQEIWGRKKGLRDF